MTSFEELAYEALKSLEPYSRQIISDCENGGELFRQKWGRVLEQARMVVAAVEAYDQQNVQATSARVAKNSKPRRRRPCR